MTTASRSPAPPAAVLVRDSKDTDIPHLAFGPRRPGRVSWPSAR
ncbi:DUF397 domain-containing protein [Streptomyces cirratus]